MNRVRGIGMGIVLALAAAGPAGAAGLERVQYYGDRPGYPPQPYPGDDGRRYGDPRQDPRYDPRYNDRRNDPRYDERRGDERRGEGGRGDGGFNGRNGGGVPGGSYLASCGNAHMEGASLVATCRGRSGRSYQAVLDTSRCGRSDIGNDNGTLQCTGARGSSRRLD